MRLRHSLPIAASLMAAAFTGLLLFVFGEMEYLKIYAPSVGNLTQYKDEIYLAVYGSDGIEMYKKYYRRSEKLPEDYDMKRLMAVTDALLEDKRRDPASKGVERWKLFLMQKRGLDPFSLKGAVLSHYADDLLAANKLTGFRGEIVRWYTLEKLDRQYDRPELYRMFLDAPAYGDNVYGIAAASRFFFGKDIKNATTLELASLTAIVSSENGPLDLKKDYQAIDRRARSVLRKLYEKGVLTAEEYYEGMKARTTIKIPEIKIIEPAYVDAAIRKITGDRRFNIGKETIKIYTGYNKKAADTARDVLDKHLKKYPKKMQMAFVLVNRETQGVEVMIGSRLPESSRNRAASPPRQMASTFKPIVYMTAFQKGVRPSDQIEDKRYDFKSGPFIYRPNNYEGFFMGRIPVRYGLVFSLNNATVRLAETTGLKEVMNMALGIGMTGDIRPFHAMALGSFGASPLNVAQMFSTIANYGMRKLPDIVMRVEKSGGISYDMLEKPKRAVSSEAAYQTVYVMQDVVRWGTARGARMLVGTAAKTGTSDKFRDGWTVALFGPYVAVCWAGFDDYSSMKEGDSGGRVAAPVIGAFQRAYFGEGSSFSFEPPENIVFAKVGAHTGLLAEEGEKGVYLEAFNKDNLPAKAKKPSKGDKVYGKK